MNWWFTGTWEFDQARFPNGLRPVVDYLHAKDIRAILWFEPERVEEWRTTVQYYWSDFWPLTPYSLDDNAWIAWQFDCPEKGEGAVQAFRRAESDRESAQFPLRGLVSDAVYTLTNLDVAGSTEMTGKELLEVGLPVATKDRPCAIIIVYKKKSP